MILSAAIEADMKKKQIDKELTLEILENYNRGLYDRFSPTQVWDIPHIDGETILDMKGMSIISIDAEKATERLAEELPGYSLEDFGAIEGKQFITDVASLCRLGVLLYPKVGYGILNGGLGTSYADELKNASAFPSLFPLYEGMFSELSVFLKNRPKGIAPAYVNPDGSPGYSYLELKFRFLLIESLRYSILSGEGPAHVAFFQMTNINTDGELADAYREYRQGVMLKDLIDAAGFDITEGRTGVQPLIAAYTHSEEGKQKGLFTRAYGRPDNLLPLPGGHGQNFRILEGIYGDLRNEGRLFAYLGNVDNLGYLIDPLSIAYLALTGKQAGFDFAFRTPLDVKGGILVPQKNGRLTCADIGPAINLADALNAEKEGKAILFNCATGLFDLTYVTDNITSIQNELPMRFSDQDKEAGRYSQAEQITWEIIGMLDDFLVFAIDKYHRFLPAKFLLETLLLSGIPPQEGVNEGNISKTMIAHAQKLHSGLTWLLSAKYGMILTGGRWEPLSAKEIIRRITNGEI